MSEMLEFIIIALVVLIIGVNVATTISPSFRRWLYSKD